MNAVHLKATTAVLFVSCGLVGVLASLSPVAGQEPLPPSPGQHVLPKRLPPSPSTNGLPKLLPPSPGKPNAKDATDPKSEADKAKLQGNWRMTSMDLGFKLIKREENLAGWKGTFEADTFFKGDRSGQIGHSDSKFKLDATRDPKRITLYDDGGKLIFRGIYILDGDTLTMCMNGDGNSVCRPEEFVTKKGQAVVMMTYKRVPAKK